MSEVGYLDATAVLAAALKFGVNPSLDGIRAMCEQMDRPQDAFASIQVTGTNGKTSTARLIAALLGAEGLDCGLFTSPELERYPERIEVAGRVVSDAEFTRGIAAALEAAARATMAAGASPGAAADATEFELLTAAALWLFRESAVEVAVLEVGMGGRWDATSVVSPAVSVITGVGLDHVAVLGDTREAIATEKAAIIVPGALAIIGPGTEGVEEVFAARAAEVGAELYAVREAGAGSPVSDDRTVRYAVRERPSSPLGHTLMDVESAHGSYRALGLRAPAYQAANVATALAAAEAQLGRGLDPARVAAVLGSIRFPGRFEVLRERPTLVVDGSHNPQAAGVLADAIADAWPSPDARPLVVLGVLADKDAAGIVSALAEVASSFAVVEPESPRALPAERLAEVVREVTGEAPRILGSAREAASTLAARSRTDVVITGSLTTAGQARGALLLSSRQSARTRG